MGVEGKGGGGAIMIMMIKVNLSLPGRQVLDKDRSGGLDSEEFCAAMRKLVCPHVRACAVAHVSSRIVVPLCAGAS